MQNINGTTMNAFSGVAWHCYGGSFSDAQTKVNQTFPHVEQILTECTGAYPSNCDVSQGM